MTCTAMTTVLMIVILILLAKHFKMKVLVSMLVISSLPLLIEAANFTSAAIASVLLAPKPSNWNKSSVCIPSGCNMAKYTWISSVSLCNSNSICAIVFQTGYMV